MRLSFRIVARRLAIAGVLSLCFAGRASANSIALSNVQVQLDVTNLIASVSAALTATVDTGSEVFLDGLNVSLEQDGISLDLTAGPTFLDDTPFFLNTPVSMVNGETTGPLVLFQLSGLAPGSLYTGSFYFFEQIEPLQVPAQAFSFTVPQLPTSTVPEPSTLLLFGSAAAIVGGRMNVRRSTRRPAE